MRDRLYIYDDARKRQLQEYETKTWFRSTPLEAAVVENGYILPPQIGRYENWQTGLCKPTMGVGGVVNDKGEFIDFSACRVEHLIHDNVLYRDEKVIYCGIFWRQWGHFLIDQITRLWYVMKRDEAENCNLIWLKLSEDEKPINGNYLEFIKLLGIDESRFEFVTVPTKFRTIIVPEPSNYSGRYYTADYNQMFECVIRQAVKNYDGDTFKKIYLSRVHFAEKTGMEVGEKSIETIFAENGYKIVYPEQLSLTDQIALINKSEIIASLEGTIAHNSLFAAAGKEQIVINRNRVLNPFQVQINDMKKISTAFIDAWEEPVPVKSLKNAPGAFWVDPCFIAVNKLFKLFCNENNMHITIKAYNPVIRLRNRIKIRLLYLKLFYINPCKKKIKNYFQSF